MNPSGRPQISRELLARMTSSSTNTSSVGGDSALGSGPVISTHRVEKRGRKHIGSYRQSAIGRRQAILSSGDRSNTQQAKSTSANISQSGSRTFQEPTSRGYNPYG